MAVTQRRTVVTDQEYELPYSQGPMASEIMATGLVPARAVHVPEVIEDRLQESGRPATTRDELHALAPERSAGKTLVVERVVTVDEEEAYRSHFLRRARETVPSYSPNTTRSEVIDLVDGQAFEVAHIPFINPINRQARVGPLAATGTSGIGSGGES